jgi:two-component system sensor histidine kinase KdpD
MSHDDGAMQSRATVAPRPSRAPWGLAVAVAVAGVAAATALVYPLKTVAPVVSLGVVYLPVVLAVAMLWGGAAGVASAFLSAAAFGFFHLPPVGRFALADDRDWIVLLSLVVVAAVTGAIAEVARKSAGELAERSREADLAATLSEMLLGAPRLADVLPQASAHLASAIGAPSSRIEIGGEDAPGPGLALVLLGEDGRRIGTLLVEPEPTEGERIWLEQRVVPILQKILSAALHRAELQAEVVETAALRRSDEIKTALLRSVSHDLRTPVTAILTAIAALDHAARADVNVAEVRDVVTNAAERLRLLIDKLLDLTLLQSGTPARSVGWCSLEEVLEEAVEQTDRPEVFNLAVDPDLPLLRADAAQLERAFANVLENSARFCADKPVLVRARVVGQRLTLRIVDQGPGIAPADRERVFTPFYRSASGTGEHHGSGLGLAIARGFIEVNGGQIYVESTPGQGTSFVIEFPAAAPTPAPAPVS